MRLMDAGAVAEKLCCSRSMIYKLMRKDKLFPLPSHKLFGESPRGWRWEDDGRIEAYIEQSRIPPLTAPVLKLKRSA